MLKAPKEEVDEHLRKVHSDPRRKEELDLEGKLSGSEEPTIPFDDGELRWQEVNDFIRKARGRSAPGTNGISYRVYKNCERLRRRLWRLLKVVWRKNHLPDSFLIAEGCFVPKQEDSSSLKDFRTISLLNVEGKVFFGILAKRLTQFLINNKYIDTSVQKGGVPGVPGCIEHNSVISKIIEDAKRNQGDLAVLWLDLTNAYGTVQHKLVDHTLKVYHVPQKVQLLLWNYFGHFKMRFNSGDFTTNWQRLEVGIVTGCTISVILFAAAMNLLVKSVEKPRQGAVLSSGVQQVPVRAFMDDLTITARSVPEGRWILEDLVELTTAARMEFRPSKSRSLVLKQGRVQNHFRFKIGEDTIPTVTEKPVKSLGRWYRADLSDKASVKEMFNQAEKWMKALERSGLPGKYKVWGYQHGILPRLLWPLLVYEVPLTTVEALERRINNFLRRWLSVPKSFCSIGLYSSGSKLKLPITSVVEEFKTAKVQLAMMLRDSDDQAVQQANIVVKTGQKWKASGALKEVEERLQHADIMGTVTQGRLGLGVITRASWKEARAKDRKGMVQKEIRAVEEESRQARAVAMKQQGSWTRWESV